MKTFAAVKVSVASSIPTAVHLDASPVRSSASCRGQSPSVPPTTTPIRPGAIWCRTHANMAYCWKWSMRDLVKVNSLYLLIAEGEFQIFHLIVEGSFKFSGKLIFFLYRWIKFSNFLVISFFLLITERGFKFSGKLILSFNFWRRLSKFPVN